LVIFPDHFSDQAILPGICLVQAVLLAGAEYQGVGELNIRMLKNLKFMQPVRPGQRVSIDAQMTPVGDGDFAIKAKLSVEDRRCAEISLVATPAAPAAGGC
jgi:3-hydroxymyristoyl/3-hydroxydecanoyl-(acyl carrier protein) dehydratase